MTLSQAAPLLLVGCGKMGGALLQGWLDKGLEAANVTIVDPNADFISPFLNLGCQHLNTAEDLLCDYKPKTIVMAVKPQTMDQIVTAFDWGQDTLVISIAAGKTIAYFESKLTSGNAIVRAMPNTPAAIGQGMTVLCANSLCSPDQKAIATDLMAAVGQTAWIEDEGLMNAVTAVSGGGPAYVFLLIETLAQAGVAAGLPVDLAHQLALVTVAGSGALALQSDSDPATLRLNVTSPGGTTLEALNVLMKPSGLEMLMIEAIEAATQRSRELADSEGSHGNRPNYS